jgi:polar amino acid transport system substrate-binding protein
VIRGDEQMPDIPEPENPTSKLIVGTTGIVMPFSYYVGKELNGYDIELAKRFAAWLNADLSFKVYDYTGIVPAAASGDIDCIMADLYATDEHKEAIAFSDPVFEVEITVAVKNNGLPQQYESLSQMQHAKVAVLTGSVFPDYVKEALPDAKILYMNSVADEVNALKSGKADAVAIDEPVARNTVAQDPSLTILPEKMREDRYAYAFRKDEEGKALCDKVSEFIIRLKHDGTLESLQKKWFDSGDVSTVEMTDYSELPGENGTIRIATLQLPPMSFSRGEISVGYEMELLSMFCRENGYAMEVTDMSSDAILPAVQSGKYDIASSGLSVTEERKETMLFSEPYYEGGAVLLIRKAVVEEDAGFFASIASSFEKTFIRENRWELFITGICTTLLITIFSVLIGTALGFFTFMLCRNGNPIANAVTRFCIWLIHGMPVVVLLMILYYIVFGDVQISGTIVSIFGFTLIFGSAVFNMMKSGVDTVDRGQKEAAYALGYTDLRAFFRVILPQALPHVIPVFKAEITSLIKATAVVGYVAVQDLTKVGDIVRSRTYEAFFPLIAVAVIYFILAAILTYFVNKIEIRIDPRRRSPEDILKGVKRQ